MDLFKLLLDFFKELPSKVQIFILLPIIILLFYIIKEYNINSSGLTKKQHFNFETVLSNPNDNTEYELKINDEPCEKVDSNKYSCEELKKGKHSYTFGKYRGKIVIEENQYAYKIKIDNIDYMIEAHDLSLKKGILHGKFAIKEKYGTHKYSSNNKITPFNLYRTEIDSYKTKDGIITFKKKWDEIANEYYSNKKLYTEYTVEESKYRTSKYYLLSKDLDINNIFSVSNDHTEQKLDINEYLGIDNNLIVYNKDNIPNINLIMLRAKEENDLNGFIKFNLIDIHKDTKINLYFGKNKLLSLFYPNYYIHKVSDDKVSDDFDVIPMYQYDKNVNLKEKYLIKKIEIIFIKDVDNCTIKATTDNHKTVISTFKCKTKKIENNNLDINFQLNVESQTKCSGSKDCILFKVSDIQTGIETNGI
ncbi:hypothetical protein AN286_09980 [Aliarcobacter cryaerophilus ATCC 43158]|uniref:Uncharacterized protein n=1 Tax=Aliarcobacter cryaerophilus ATCC 43158 TaxID=1032070 RepID=A0AAD0TU79_9BACT|nr:hypothetical protein ACRYA_1375 [Aliarcobacter cryaerophilus ATCC 43158]PRM91465.1 hypothetical protein CJ667_10670 [Aliarcobacter cryaerophilus]QCZ24709.1 hypothetical protein AN286_09980 [Aliarcobacter cryaerophilus ATCC 43158]